MEAVNSVYKEVKKMFQTAVPPYVATVNDDYHYEVWAIKKQAGESQVSEELLGYVAKHEDSVTVGFNNKLGEKITFIGWVKVLRNNGEINPVFGETDFLHVFTVDKDE